MDKELPPTNMVTSDISHFPVQGFAIYRHLPVDRPTDRPKSCSAQTKRNIAQGSPQDTGRKIPKESFLMLYYDDDLQETHTHKKRAKRKVETLETIIKN